MAHIAAGFGRKAEDAQKMYADFDINRAPFHAAVVLFVAAACALGQDAMILSSGSAVAGASVSLNLSLIVTPGSEPAALEWTYSYAAKDFTAVSVTAGPAAVAAGKSVSCAGSSGSYTCLLFGLNNTALTSGVVASATFTVSPTTTDTSATIPVINTSGATVSSTPVSVTATSGQVTITPNAAVTGLTCSPATITTPGSAACKTALAAPAPAGGATIALRGGTANFSIPSSVAVAAGATSAGFKVNASAVSMNTTEVLVASLNGGSQTLTLTLAPINLTHLSCSPTTLSSHSSSKCKITLSAAAPSGGLHIAIQRTGSTALSAPSSVTAAAGSKAAGFSVQAGTINSSQTATLSATRNGNSVSTALTLTSASTKSHP
ncbi:MAG: hypothetical protein LAP39_22530 [Acidobacteriia bacterium]|nr:hypothetical protein [Terriglobia bacterium]